MICRQFSGKSSVVVLGLPTLRFASIAFIPFYLASDNSKKNPQRSEALDAGENLARVSEGGEGVLTATGY
jgi:hypothetical protein